MKNLTKAEFIKIARDCARDEKEKFPAALESLLDVAYGYPLILNKKPSIQQNSSEKEVRDYFSAFMPRYFNARRKAASFKPPGTMSDPALEVVLESFGSIKSSEMKKKAIRLHRLGMAAETTLGALLEMYVSTVLEPEGWLWCCGNIVEHVDFYKPGKPILLLQIKNRSNSENAASAGVRKTGHNDAPVEIRKWHRINAKDANDTYWHKLPGNEHKQLADEEQFRAFIRNQARRWKKTAGAPD